MDRSIFIYGEIGWEANVAEIQNQIQAPGAFDKLVVHISSHGGGVFDGWTIGNIIKNLGVETEAHIEGLCASIATFIALSCNKVLMADTGRFMIHNPMTFAEGESDQMEQAQEQLDAIKADLMKSYHSKTGIALDQLSVMMDEETWLTPEEAIEAGFVDELMEPIKAVAKFDIKNNNKMKKVEKNAWEKATEEIKKHFDSVLANFKKESLDDIVNIIVELADGSSIFIESEDGEFEGKNAFTEEGGEPVVDGTFALSDGRSITIEGGVVVSVQEEDIEDKLKDRIKDLETQLSDVTEEKEKSDDKVKDAVKEVTDLAEEFKNLQSMTVGDNKPPLKRHRESARKIEQKEAHSLDGFSSYLNNLPK